MTVSRDLGNYLPLTLHNIPEDLNFYIKLNCGISPEKFCTNETEHFNTSAAYLHVRMQ
jgi:hypothetical protein